MKMKFLALSPLVISCTTIFAQEVSNAALDSIYLAHVEEQTEPFKVLHAEPLYIDLIRDLGARKGEKEWNVGLGLTDKLRYDRYEALVEYEWAPVNRLGLEVELPFTFYTASKTESRDSIPAGKLNGLKLAIQWSFFVNERASTSMALGYINELELSDFRNFGRPLIPGNIYNPFLVVAKRWGSNLHSLLYTGPMLQHHFQGGSLHVSYDINTSVHYMITGTRNFVGIEFNKTLVGNNFDMTIRPQMRLGVFDNLMVGIVAGIPVSKDNERLGAFVRLIWEPGHKRH
ncbi:MAG: phosphoribosylformylglycinamidine synthase [Bacteroidetes bacterium]|nr:MAG: phosphoribosylformylglycinamidine synthase [Bacteroidota bacterium]